MKGTFRALLILLIATAGTASAQDATPLRVGIATDYAPLCYKEGDTIKGVEAEFAQQLGKDLSRQVDLVELPREQLIPALRDKRIDVIMSGMSITKDRGKLVAFTQPYLRVGQMALIRSADFQKLHDYAKMNLPATKIGVQKGTTGAQYAHHSLSKAQIKEYENPDAGIAALRANEIDFFIHDAPTIWRVRGREAEKYADLAGRYRPLTDENLAWAVRLKDHKLRDQLNDALDHWRDNGFLEHVLDVSIPLRKYEVSKER